MELSEEDPWVALEEQDLQAELHPALEELQPISKFSKKFESQFYVQPQLFKAPSEFLQVSYNEKLQGKFPSLFSFYYLLIRNATN